MGGGFAKGGTSGPSLHLKGRICLGAVNVRNTKKKSVFTRKLLTKLEEGLTTVKSARPNTITLPTAVGPVRGTTRNIKVKALLNLLCIVLES